MNKVVFDDDDCKELYRLLTGHALFGLESDFLEKQFLLENQIIQEELEKLIFPDSCLLCNVHKCSNHDIENHKMGKTHRKKVEQYIKGRLETLQNKKDAENSYCHINIQDNQSLDLTKHVKEILPTMQQKLEDLLLSHYCYVCSAVLSTPHNANSHYNSSKHLKNVQHWKDKNTSQTENIIQQQLTVLIKLDYCYICNAKLTGHVQAQSHYESNRHKSKVKSWVYEQTIILQPKNKNSDEILPTSYNITKISTVQKSEHNLIDEHKRNSEVCFVCNIKTMSKEQLAEHVKGRRHKNKISMQKSSSSLDIPRTIITPVKKKDKALSHVSKPDLLPSISSSVTKVKVKNLDVVKEHATAVAHEGKIQQPRPTVSTYLESLPKTAEGHLKEVNDILKNKENYCNLCKITFGSKADVDKHIKTFPHQEISKIKSSLVSKGISIQEFWSCDKTKLQTIYCSLCNVSIQSSSSAVGHFESKRHSSKFNIWCTLQVKNSENPNRKWYFCDICNQHLDGTTNIEFHYKGKKHAAQYTTQAFQTATTSKPLDIPKEDTPIWINFNNTQLGLIKKRDIDEETTQAQMINSTDKNNNTNTIQNIPNNTSNQIEPTGTIIIRNKSSKISQEFSNPSTQTGSIIYSKEFVTTMEKINNKSNGALKMDMEKFACALDSVPLNVAQRYLQNCTKKLEESIKNGKVLDIELENTIDNNVCLTKKKRKSV